jgi:predicted metal-binding membrane protein
MDGLSLRGRPAGLDRPTARQLVQLARTSSRWHPEWPVAALAGASWLALLAGLGGMHSHPAEAHHSPLSAAAELPAWSLMVVAMMVPLTLPAARYLALNTMRGRRPRATAIYTASYVAVWGLFGTGVLMTDHLFRFDFGLGSRLLLTLSLVAAAGWQLTRSKRRALYACGQTVPLPPAGRRADEACVRFACLHACRCIQSCWAIMVVLVAVDRAALAWMAVLTVLVLAEELTLSGRRLTRPAAALFLVAAAAVAVGA